MTPDSVEIGGDVLIDKTASQKWRDGMVALADVEGAEAFAEVANERLVDYRRV